MANISIDFSEFQQTVSDEVPNGDYIAKIKSVALAEPKPDKARQIIVRSEIADGPAKGMVLVDYLAIEGRAVFNVRALLQAIGQTVSGKSLSINTDKMVGKRVAVQVGRREWQGRTFMNLRYSPVVTTTDEAEDTSWADDEAPTAAAPVAPAAETAAEADPFAGATVANAATTAGLDEAAAEFGF